MHRSVVYWAFWMPVGNSYEVFCLHAHPTHTCLQILIFRSYAHSHKDIWWISWTSSHTLHAIATKHHIICEQQIKKSALKDSYRGHPNQEVGIGYASKPNRSTMSTGTVLLRFSAPLQPPESVGSAISELGLDNSGKALWFSMEP